MSFLTFITYTTIVLYLLHRLAKWFFHRNDDFWPNQKVTFLDSGVIASFFERITFKISLVDLFQKTYDYFPDAPYFGQMQLGKPVFFVKDLDIVKTILVKDFDYFTERNPLSQNKSDPHFSKMVINKAGKEWKDLRSLMTPTFTTGKIKGMFPFFNSCGHHLVNYLKAKETAGESEINFHDCFGRFTVDAIAAIAFGMNTDVFEDESTFRKMAKKFSTFTLPRLIKIVSLVVMPRLAGGVLKLKISEPESTKFFSEIFEQNIAHRRQEKDGQRNDFLQLMLQAQAGQLKAEVAELKGEGEGEAETEGVTWKAPVNKSAVVLDDITILANCLGFFSAGTDTMETVLTFAAYRLALHPEIQEKLTEEVTKEMEQNDGNLTYEMINQFEYLDMIVAETLRLYPPAFGADRQCVKDYTLNLPDGKTINLPKGCRVLIPISAIQHDPKYYPEPEKFRPENFSPENKNARHPYAYLPFGAGPRGCIAVRFALIEAKAALAHLIYKFKIEPCSKTEDPVIFSRKAIILKPENGMFLKFTSRR